MAQTLPDVQPSGDPVADPVGVEDAFDFYRPLGERDVGVDDDDDDAIGDEEVAAPTDCGFGSDGFADDGFACASPDTISGFVDAVAAADAAEPAFFADFSDFQSAPAPPPPVPVLTSTEVDVIKATMATLDIAPPPWVRKMQQVQRIRAMQAQAEASAAGSEVSSGGGPSAVAGAAPMAHQWAAEVQLRASSWAPEAASLLSSGSSLAGAVPTAAGPAGTLSGVLAPKKVTGKQLAAERRLLREQAKRKAAEERTGTAAA